MTEPTAGNERIYHRLESPSQTPEDTIRQARSGAIWGRAARGANVPTVKAYTGPLPPGRRGIEFTTSVPVDYGCAPGRAEWSGPRPGVIIDGEFAKIYVMITKNTQT